MSDEEFDALLAALLADLPDALIAPRLARLVRALIETGGDPAAHVLRALLRLRDTELSAAHAPGHEDLVRSWGRG